MDRLTEYHPLVMQFKPVDEIAHPVEGFPYGNPNKYCQTFTVEAAFVPLGFGGNRCLTMPIAAMSAIEVASPTSRKPRYSLNLCDFACIGRLDGTQVQAGEKENGRRNCQGE